MKVTSQENITRPDMEKGHFNAGEHLFIDIDKCSNQTIVCKLPNGKFVTFSFVPGSGGELECVDIHSTVGRHWTDDKTLGRHHWEQKLVGFGAGYDSFDSRECKHPTTLATLLLHSSHHQQKCHKAGCAVSYPHASHDNLSAS